MKNTYVSVCLYDLNAMASIISNIDDRHNAPSLENITKLHNLIIKMSGDHASKLYADDENFEKEELSCVT